MGVTQLWSVVQPCARPIKIETLNRKRLAVDSSLWIYQFLKAVRDKEGNALRNSHVVGFYRRICKLLYLGIKPVFVFDGGAPALKRQTIAGRKSRREGRREDAVRTAGKLLALQMQRAAEEEAEKERQRHSRANHPNREEEEVPDEPVYLDELQMTQQERQRNRKFKKKDQYHLPDLDVSLAEMGQPNDPRVMSLEELEQYARQFDSGEDINVYDFSKIDFDSPFFLSLPPTDRYNILNAARLRSRLRMGLSKDQLDNMFPDRMAFSRFQIDRVKERNELTQRLMHVNGMTDDSMFGVDGSGRVAGEKGREYVLVKNTGVEGGWALGVIGDKDQGERNKPIDVDEVTKPPKLEDEIQQSEDEDDAFEDIPIEGLNRLPKVISQQRTETRTSNGVESTENVLKRREAFYQSRRGKPSDQYSAQVPQEPDESTSLFISEPGFQQENASRSVDASAVDDEEELQRAIAMSLENGGRVSSPDDDEYQEVFNVDSSNSTAGRSTGIAIQNKPGDSYAAPIADESDDEAGMMFEDALIDTVPPPAKGTSSSESNSASNAERFDGPLPFEKLDLGSSILGKKKMKKIEQDNAGGFQKDLGAEKKQNQSNVLPPWFSDDLISGLKAQDNIQKEDREQERKADEDNFIFPEQPKLRKQQSSAIIDVDAIDENGKDVIHVESDDEKSATPEDFDAVEIDREDRMDDIADLTRANPPRPQELEAPEDIKDRQQSLSAPSPVNEATEPAEAPRQDLSEEEELLEWEESDREEPETRTSQLPHASGAISHNLQASHSRSPSLEFEEVKLDNPSQVNNVETEVSMQPSENDNDNDNDAVPMAEEAEEAPTHTIDESDEEQYYSEVEDEELMMQLATESEEHARFASTLNQKTQKQNIEEYERELKALQTQQKKDRRDADEVTQIMITECQQLLKLFGLPYITAPMEAEAQCAELVSLGLVDGIVTDDSDVFLFGGTRIYKNMFNQAKYVECYLGSDLEREFDLTREKLIRIAHLLGSDYTEGLPGIGPVTALEIVSEFPGGLDEFKEWWEQVQMGAKPSEVDQASPFRKKFRRNAARLFLPPTFPDQRVNQAYLNPEVDSDPSAFQWGVPDLDALRAYLMATVGWTPERTDEVLVPVIRDMNRRENEGTQANITSFIGGGSGGGGAGAFAPRRRDVGKSKRMEGALEKLAERAREKRKAAALGPGNGETAAADDQDRAVLDDEAVIAVQGSAVEDSPAAKRKPGGSKRKEASSGSKAVRFASDAEMSDDQGTKRTRTKSRKKGK